MIFIAGDMLKQLCIICKKYYIISERSDCLLFMRFRMAESANSLPDNIVSSPTLDTFKARLDKFWENQDVRYNWKAVHRKSK